MNVIEIKNISKSFYDTKLFWKRKTFSLDNLSLNIKKREFLGIIGPNGSGKTTLLKLISGILKPEKGNIKCHDEIFSLIGLGAGFNNELTGRENIFFYGSILGISSSVLKDNIDYLIEFSGLEDAIDFKLKTYSTGMRIRLAFSIVALKQPSILLLDEIFAVGDREFQEKSMNYISFLNKKGSTVVLVSHDLESIKKACTRIIYLHNGKIIYNGNPHKAIGNYLSFLTKAKEFLDLRSEIDELKKDKNMSDFNRLIKKSNILKHINEKIRQVEEQISVNDTLVSGTSNEKKHYLVNLSKFYRELLTLLNTKERITETNESLNPKKKKIIYHLIDIYEKLILIENLNKNSKKIKQYKDNIEELYSLLDKCFSKTIKKERLTSAGFGTKEAVITKVEFVYPGKGKTFYRGQPFKAIIHYNTTKKIKSPMIGVAIHTKSGLWIAGPNTSFSNFKIDEINGIGKIEFLIENLPLIRGEYDFSATIYNYFGSKPLDHHYKKYRFRVKDESTEKYGSVYIDHQWKF